MLLPSIHIQPAQHGLKCTCPAGKQCEIISIKHVGHAGIFCPSYCPPHILSNQSNIINTKFKKRVERGHPCLTPRVGCTRAAFAPSLKISHHQRTGLG
eukprot:550940-Pelagomonas_calceolata.AAC.1